eukprot:s1190_g9.t1
MSRPPSRPKTAPANVNAHSFRDRDKKKERQISEREFGVHYETEKERVQRHEAENHGNMLSRDPWPPNQHAPLHLTPRDTRCNTRLRTRDSRPKPIIDTIGEYLVSEIRLPYSPGYPELREKPKIAVYAESEMFGLMLLRDRLQEVLGAGHLGILEPAEPIEISGALELEPNAVRSEIAAIRKQLAALVPASAQLIWSTATERLSEEFSALVALQFRLQEAENGREIGKVWESEICQVESCIFLS